MVSHFCPAKCVFSNSISGIMRNGVRGEVVINSILLSILAIVIRILACCAPGKEFCGLLSNWLSKYELQPI